MKQASKHVLFCKKEPKNHQLFAGALNTRQMRESLIASFSSEKEDSSFLFTRKPE
jgi:hypothetical protein